MAYKNNYDEFKKLIEQHHITTLYHFTDRENLESIIKNGGLYSWADCEQKGISISKPGGSMDSRNLEISLSFIPLAQQNSSKSNAYIVICSSYPVGSRGSISFSDFQEPSSSRSFGMSTPNMDPEAITSYLPSKVKDFNASLARGQSWSHPRISMSFLVGYLRRG